MSIKDLKSQLHQIVDNIEDEQLLYTLHEFLTNRNFKSNEDFWSTLSVQQQEELLNSFNQSESDEKLISNEKVFLNDL